MNISGVIIRSKPRELLRVKELLSEIEGVEVHGVSDDGRMVLTVEGVSDDQLFNTVNDLQNIDGVLSASMVYHHFEDIGANERVVQERA